MKTICSFLSVIALVASVTGFSASLQEKKDREKAWKNIETEKTIFKRHCGGEMPMEIDWDSFKWESGHKAGSAVAFCGGVLGAAAHVCESGKDGKEAINNKVKKIVCTYKEGAVTTKTFAKEGLKFNGTTLNVTFDWKTGNIGKSAEEFLMGNL